MHYLVDGYNLLFRCLRKSGILEKSRQALIEEMNEIASLVKIRVTIVFDGSMDHFLHPSRGHFDTLELVYTPKHKSADDYIYEEVEHAKNASQITVVTNDRKLFQFCKLHRAKHLTIDGFLAFLAKKKERAAKKATQRTRFYKESDKEIARLLALFEKKLEEEG